jgi:hypothetical protein
MKRNNDFAIYNLDTIEAICHEKDISLERLLNFLFDQYIIYYNEAVKTISPDDIEPRDQDIQEKKIMSFKHFMKTKPATGRKAR